MKRNMGLVDRIIRLIAAIGIIALVVAGTLRGTAAVVLGIVALVFLGTSAAGICPLYSVLGFATKKRAKGGDVPPRIDV